MSGRANVGRWRSVVLESYEARLAFPAACAVRAGAQPGEPGWRGCGRGVGESDYFQELKPILDGYSGCHYCGTVAPFALTTYAEAHGRAKSGGGGI
jgi:hypothetical protein